MMADAAAATIAARSTTTSTPSTRSPSLQALPTTRCDHSNHGPLSARRSQCCGTAAPARSQWSGPPPPLTAMPAGSTAARPLAPASQRWHRRCQEATAALPAALRSGGSGSSAACTAQLRALWRCPAGSAVCIVAPPAAPGQHWRCIRAAPEPAAPRGSASATWLCPPAALAQNRERIGAQARKDCGGQGRTSQTEPMKYYDYTRLTHSSIDALKSS